MKTFLQALVLSLTVVLVTGLDTANAQDADGKLGVGVMVGEPTGISLKYWQNDRNALDGGIAWSLGQYDAIHLHADYLWHNYSVFSEVEEGSLPLYYGIGGRLVLGDNDSILGVRAPVGLNYLFEESPIGLFVEVTPTLNLTPATDFDIGGALGIRVRL